VSALPPKARIDSVDNAAGLELSVEEVNAINNSLYDPGLAKIPEALIPVLIVEVFFRYRKELIWPATTQYLLVVQAINLYSLEYRAKIELRANTGRFSFTARSGFTQASGIAPLREFKLLLDETYNRDINSNSSSLV
jgi:hypothetical protein